MGHRELRALGLVPEVDPAGNLIARWEAGEGPAVMAASHLDTVPNGGALRRRPRRARRAGGGADPARRGFEPARPIWIGSFMDEEGTRFGAALFGSRPSRARHEAAWTPATPTASSPPRRWPHAGIDPDRVGEASASPTSAAYLELHVEQGPVLDSAGQRLGIVESITGVLGFRVRSTARRTTPARRRRTRARTRSSARRTMVLALRERALRRTRSCARPSAASRPPRARSR